MASIRFFDRGGMMVNTIDLNKKFYDPMADFRAMAIAGKISNAPKTIRDIRSRKITVH